MGRKQDINQGAGMACLVVGGIVGFSSGSFWAGVATFIVLVIILGALKIVR